LGKLLAASGIRDVRRSGSLEAHQPHRTGEIVSDHLSAAKRHAHLPQSIELGTFRVTALCDGQLELPAAFIDAPDGDEQPIAGEVFHLTVNTFLVQSATTNVLVDSGGGSTLGPDLNGLTDGLRALGLTPADIDAVLCTHIHPDHTNGLVNKDGQPLFAAARVLVHERELGFWLSDVHYASAEAHIQFAFDSARAAFLRYRGRIEPFGAGEVLPGIHVVPLFGHTPGHSGFHIDGGGDQQLIVWGDVVHDVVRQVRDPNVSVQLDVDRHEARASRIGMFDRASADDVLVAGMHVAFPGFGHLERSRGKFSYSPLPL